MTAICKSMGGARREGGRAQGGKGAIEIKGQCWKKNNLGLTGLD